MCRRQPYVSANTLPAALLPGVIRDFVNALSNLDGQPISRMRSASTSLYTGRREIPDGR